MIQNIKTKMQKYFFNFFKNIIKLKLKKIVLQMKIQMLKTK